MEGHEAHQRYVKNFFDIQFPKGDVPIWAVEALATADIHITTTLTAPSVEENLGVGGGNEEEGEGGEEMVGKKAKVDSEEP